MPPVMTKEEARIWRKRWNAMRAFERHELQHIPMESKFRQLASMMQTARVLNWRTSTPEEVEHVRQLWVRLKSRFHESA